jgi:ribosomal protein S18 acetylase RimI-like enzyme
VSRRGTGVDGQPRTRPGENGRGRVRDRLLSPDEWCLARDARLAALRDSPEAFLPQQPPESSWSEEHWRRSWQSGLWAVAQADGGIVGLARLSREWADVYVESVWTHPRYRRRGVASALVRRLIANAPPARRGGIFVWVIHPNDAAFSLYESLGFQPTDDKQLLSGLDRIEERLRLGDE